MAREEVQETVSVDERGGITATHPAYGLVTVTRRSNGEPAPLFGSDLPADVSFVFEVHRAQRVVEYGREREAAVRGRPLLVFEMSAAQVGALLPSVGVMSGVPVTVCRTESEPVVPDVPARSRYEESVAQVQGLVGELMAQSQETLARLEEAIERRAGVRELREVLAEHQRTVSGAAGRAGWVASQVAEAAETLRVEARAAEAAGGGV